MPMIITILAAAIVGGFVIVMLVGFLLATRGSGPRDGSADADDDRPLLDDGDRRAGGPEFRAGALAVAEADPGDESAIGTPLTEMRAAEPREQLN